MSKAILMLVMVLCGFLQSHSFANDQQSSVRELLAKSKNVQKLIAVDDFNTYVAPTTGGFTGEITDEFMVEFSDICYKSGGKLEKRFVTKDSFTNQSSEGWAEVPADKIAKTRITLDSGDNLRCSGAFTFSKIYKSQLRNQYGQDIGRVNSFILHHNTIQPQFYKNENFLSKDNVEMLKEGSLYDALKGKIKASEGGLFGMGSWQSEEDVFLYLSSLCTAGKGKLRTVIRREGDLLEASNYEAFHYILVGGHSRQRPFLSRAFELYFACDGGNKFATKITHEFSDMSKGAYVAKGMFVPNRGLEGLKIIDVQFRLDAQSVTPQPSSANLTSAVTTVSSPDSIQDGLAIGIAANKMNILKATGAQEYNGIYNDKNAQGCDVVAVIKKWDVSRPNGRIDTTNYTICGGVIAKVAETPFDRLPVEIDQIILKTARMAQRTGTAEFVFRPCRPLVPGLSPTYESA